MLQAEPVTLQTSALDRALATIERRRGLIITAFSAMFLAICALLAATKMMWYDELVTYYPATLPLRDLLSFFNQALDVHTPTASILVKASMKMFGDGPVVDRLPMIAGFLIMCLAIYGFTARRLPPIYAIAAMIFPAVSGVFYYATELRDYGIELGFAGVALLCWQDAAGGRRRTIAVPGLFLGLIGAICCHYFAIFLLIPFGLAELARAWTQKRIDVPVWLAILLSPAVLLVFLHAIREGRLAYTADVWAKPGLGQISNAYLTMLTPAFVPILAAAVIYFLLAPRFSRPAEGLSRPPLAERVLVTALALAPAYVVPLSYLVGTYVLRYTLYSIAGISIFLAFEMCWALKGDRVAALALSVALIGWFASKSATTLHGQMAENGGLRVALGEPYRQSPWMGAIKEGSLPVMATPAVFFLQLQQYAADAVRPRVVYAGDFDLARRFDHSANGETNLFRFRRMLPIRVEQFNDFVAAHPHFLLAADTSTPTWHLPALIERGAQLRLLNRTETYLVFDVTVPR